MELSVIGVDESGDAAVLCGEFLADGSEFDSWCLRPRGNPDER